MSLNLDISDKSLEDLFKKAIQNKKFMDQLYNASKEKRTKLFDKRVRVYYPSKAFPSISVTGTQCYLHCKHCNRKYLQGMIPITTAQKLIDFCHKHAEKGGTGCLISGGYTAGGFVPLNKFINTIKEIKETTSLEINVHTGIVDKKMAEALAYAGVDSVSIDVSGDIKIIREIYGLQKTPEDYYKSLINLKDAGIRITPHIGIGFYYGKIDHEFEAMRMIKKIEPDVLVFVVFRPTPGTPLENLPPPPLEHVLLVMALARLYMNNTPISLGCMRPSGKYRLLLEEKAVEIAADRIATPARSTVSKFIKEGYVIEELNKCCTL